MSVCSRFRWFGLNALTLLALAGLTTACNGQSGLADGDSSYTESTVGEDELGEGTIDTSLEGQESELGIVPIAPSSPSHAAVESESAEAFPLELLDQRIANDPRLVEAWLVWSRCMSGEGFEFENRERIFEQLDTQVEVFDNVAASGATELPSDLEPEFAAFRDNEVEIKEADLLCADHVENVERVVRIDLELEFIEEFGLSRAR